ncbi:MAG: DUF4342 domain-containing protein [Acidobacteria bacterium]|nr:DUF4342 domain-containing protein [Acidobacteriota bacterium]
MERTFWQKLEGTTDQVIAQLRKLVEEGNIRRVVVKQKGKTVAEFPLTAGVIGAVIAPVAAAIGALTALIADCSIEVEKTVVDKTVNDVDKTSVASHRLTPPAVCRDPSIPDIFSRFDVHRRQAVHRASSEFPSKSQQQSAHARADAHRAIEGARHT